jgi:hypothetical protein
MRPLRLLCSVAFLFFLFFVILISLLQPIPSNHGTSAASSQRSGFGSLFSFHAPTSLFPPSAIISLTDDNTTFFLARPALYGPPLPADGLSGQLWVGAGFGDDTLIRDGMVLRAQGELGCSDVPGWTADRATFFADMENVNVNGVRDFTSHVSTTDKIQDSSAKSQGSKHARSMPAEDDGTDDYLHYPLIVNPLLRNTKIRSKRDTPTGNAEHADIQSLQESAEIAGKVVLLSRGGCGFYEKTKWVQRRGGIALIVGDYTRGGSLVQMSAHGDTSNVTIPSIFTAYTSAHLLSSLVPSMATSDIEKDKTPGNPSIVFDKPTFTPATNKPRETGSAATRVPSKSKTTSSSPTGQNDNWMNSLAGKLGITQRNDAIAQKDSRRPPSSGTITWVESQDWDDDTPTKSNRKTVDKSSNSKSDTKGKEAKSDDNFVIGVHDWRDADIVAQEQNKDENINVQGRPTTKTTASLPKSTSDKAFSGGSRAPESGVYESLRENLNSKQNSKVVGKAKSGYWFQSLHQASAEENFAKENNAAKEMYRKEIAPHFIQDQEFKDEDAQSPIEHEGLWVTMTPTNISASPFFDTLLVLVVSPLVTLTVVYILLILRSRIRRRRWRAPRSVVEQLPVRTYHTMSYSSSTSSSQTPSPHASSPSSPLLQSANRSGLPKARPRSATMSSIRHEVSSSLERATSRLSPREKMSTFKRKYSARQVECVVCLEEYIDGQSRVMSLPCGHEFHVECM